jgi:hypothetical protein
VQETILAAVLKTSKTLGLGLPASLLALANEVIEGWGFFAALHESGSGSAPRRRESSVEAESTRRVVD